MVTVRCARQSHAAAFRISISHELDDRICDAHAVTAELMSQIIAETCRRYPPVCRTRKSVVIERLIHSGAWTDAAFALIDLELPQWHVRRLVYDEGEWHCALSRQRELPEWLDASIEPRRRGFAARHLDCIRRCAAHRRANNHHKCSPRAAHCRRALRTWSAATISRMKKSHLGAVSV